MGQGKNPRPGLFDPAIRLHSQQLLALPRNLGERQSTATP
jgi:hypothetical protein